MKAFTAVAVEKSTAEVREYRRRRRRRLRTSRTGCGKGPAQINVANPHLDNVFKLHPVEGTDRYEAAASRGNRLGPALRVPHTPQESGIHHRGRAHVRPRHRREHRHLLDPERGDFSAARLSSAEATPVPDDAVRARGGRAE